MALVKLSPLGSDVEGRGTITDTPSKTQVTGSETVAGAAVSSPLAVEHFPNDQGGLPRRISSLLGRKRKKHSKWTHTLLKQINMVEGRE
jgi:hypothetical protein